MSSQISICNRSILIAFVFLLFVFGNKSAFGQEEKAKVPAQPNFVKAVAPIVIPFVYGDAGVNEVTIKVTINNEGKVTSAQITKVSIMRDKYLEDVAKQWIFESSPNKEERTAEINFILRIMPEGTDMFDVTTTFTYPAQMEVRHAVFPRPITY